MVTSDGHLRKARYYAEKAENNPRGMMLELAPVFAALATMHYLGYLAEAKWSEDPYNDGRQL